MDASSELALREQVMYVPAELTAGQGYVSREQLSALLVSGTTRQIIDTFKGIWNPRYLQATLSVASSRTGLGTVAGTVFPA